MSLCIRELPIPFRMQPGLERLGDVPPRWTALDARSDLARVRGMHKDDALLHVPELDLPHITRALMATVREQGWSVPDLDAHELGRWFCEHVQEDWVLFDPDQGRVHALLVCAPTHWTPQTVLGKSFSAIHAPVADNQRLLSAAPALMQWLRSGTAWKRQVWTLCPDAGLDRHPQRHEPAAWPTVAAVDWAEKIHWRVEEQRFHPLPGTGLCLMTIRLHQAALAVALKDDEEAAHLADVLESMTEAVASYKGLLEVRPRLLNWLRTAKA